MSRGAGKVGKNAGDKCSAGQVGDRAARRVTRYSPDPFTAEPAPEMHSGCDLNVNVQPRNVMVA